MTHYHQIKWKKTASSEQVTFKCHRMPMLLAYLVNKMSNQINLHLSVGIAEEFMTFKWIAFFAMPRCRCSRSYGRLINRFLNMIPYFYLPNDSSNHLFPLINLNSAFGAWIRSKTFPFSNASVLMSINQYQSTRCSSLDTSLLHTHISIKIASSGALNEQRQTAAIWWLMECFSCAFWLVPLWIVTNNDCIWYRFGIYGFFPIVPAHANAAVILNVLLIVALGIGNQFTFN